MEASGQYNKIATQLNESSWWAHVGNITRAYTFHYEPTFFHKGGVFKLSYLDQCKRYAPDVAFAIQPDSIILYGQFDGVEWKATYTGGNLLRWVNDAGKSMTWERVTNN